MAAAGRRPASTDGSVAALRRIYSSGDEMDETMQQSRGQGAVNRLKARCTFKFRLPVDAVAFASMASAPGKTDIIYPEWRAKPSRKL